MADCTSCGQALGSFRDDELGRCLDCANGNKPATLDKPSAQNREAQRVVENIRREKARREKERAHQQSIKAILLTTETAPDLSITKRIEIVTAECAFGMNIFKDLFAEVRDIVGGRSEAVQKTMRDARRTALFELKREAYAVGANAVVGIDLDYVELSAAGSMVMLVASGTAVVIDDQSTPDTNSQNAAPELKM